MLFLDFLLLESLMPLEYETDHGILSGNGTGVRKLDLGLWIRAVSHGTDAGGGILI